MISRASSRGRRSVMFEDERIKNVYDMETSLSEEQQQVIHSMRSMLQSELSLTDSQRSALGTIRETLLKLVDETGADVTMKSASEEKEAEKGVEICEDTVPVPEKMLSVPAETEGKITPVSILKRKTSSMLTKCEMLNAALTEDFNARTLTMFILANSIAGTCMRMGLEPASLFIAFANLNRMNLADMDPGQKLSVFLVDTPDIAVNELRKFHLPGATPSSASDADWACSESTSSEAFKQV